VAYARGGADLSGFFGDVLAVNVDPEVFDPEAHNFPLAIDTP
jgi:hypothetical protein